MSFVHGHARDTGWVMAHRRRPNGPEEGQLPLIPEPVVPGPREPADRERVGSCAHEPGYAAQEDQAAPCGGRPGEAFRSDRKSAITLS